jgi:flagellar assembly factor FliW
MRLARNEPMPQVRTKHFATIDYEEGAELTFPLGLPAFERLTRFLLIEHPSISPLAFLQSIEEQGVCLPVLPVLVVEPDYELSLTAEDLEALGFTSLDTVPDGHELGCFTIVTIPGTGPVTANLLAPVVVNVAARRAVQAVRADARYSHRHPVTPAAPSQEGVCS